MVSQNFDKTFAQDLIELTFGSEGMCLQSFLPTYNVTVVCTFNLQNGNQTAKQTMMMLITGIYCTNLHMLQYEVCILHTGQKPGFSRHTYDSTCTHARTHTENYHYWTHQSVIGNIANMCKFPLQEMFILNMMGWQ